MRKATVTFLVGLLVGQLDPVGLLVWKLIEQRLPGIEQASLAAPSPFERMPKTRWITESENAYAIEDTYAPTAPVHLLVVPKQRYSTLLDAPAPVLGEMLDLARKVARERGIAESGFRIVINTRPQGGQTVYHLHMHVKGGHQLREPLLPLLWGRLTHARRRVSGEAAPASAGDLRSLRIAPFSRELESQVVELIVSIQRGEFGIDISAEQQPDLRAIPSFYQTGAGGFWLALAAGRVVGTIALLDLGSGQAALRKMFVHADFRGPARGVAHALLDVLLEHARQNGVREIFLGTTAAFHAAHRFYEKRGFSEIAKRALPVSFPVMEVDTRFYALRFREPTPA